MIQSFQFTVALVVTQHILSYTRPLAQALQKADCDIVKAYVDANTCKKVIREQREDSVDVMIEYLLCVAIRLFSFLALLISLIVHRFLQQWTDEPFFVPFFVSRSLHQQNPLSVL
jgi:hypothetical protein